MRALQALWRRLRGAFRPAPVAAIPAPVKPLQEAAASWARLLEALMPEPNAERHKLKLPDVLPGVRPDKPPAGEGLKLAMDGGYQEPAAFDGTSEPAAWSGGGVSTFGPGLAFLGFPYLAELAQITEYRTPTESLSTEMTRTWLKLKNKGDGDKTDKIAKLEERFEQLKIRDLFREAALKTEQFGRAHIYVSVEDQDDPLNRQNPLTEVPKGKLKRFSCIEPYWLTPYSWNSTEPERPDFYRPQSWYVLGRKTHHTRLLTFIFREVPDLLKPAYDFAGISMTQLMMPYVQRWLRTAKNVNDLINIFSIVTLATDLQTMLQKPIDDPSSLPKRVQGFTQLRDNRGMMIVNKASEELSMQNVPLGSLDKLQAQAQEHMATPARMPLIKFFGITPTGLNTTGATEGEMECWYAYTRAMQRVGFDAHVERVLAIVQMDMFGQIDPDITHEWLPLYEPTPKEIAENRKADTERDATLIDKGVVDAGEVREKLKKDPASGYDGLEGPPPEPPEVSEFNLNEQGAENAHERSEESAEAAHERQKETPPAGPPGRDEELSQENYRLRRELKAAKAKLT